MENVELMFPRFMIASSSSGSGKTLITCALLHILKNRGFNPVSFKCGPDFIDPLFHKQVLGIPSFNIDSYFISKELTYNLFLENLLSFDKKNPIAVIEGVMGYYDGLSVDSFISSSYEIADITNSPVILVIDCKGAGRTLSSTIFGLCNYVNKSHIQGVILNNISSSLYVKLKEQIEQDTKVKVLGFLPKEPSITFQSRHLGLFLPQEIKDINVKIEKTAELLMQSLDIESLLEIAKSARYSATIKDKTIIHIKKKYPISIAIAKDNAFCFYYEDNIRLLKRYGVNIVYFSPLHDRELPKADGLIIGGGYPELYASELEKNVSMRSAIFYAAQNGIPILAECGGFMYLQQSLEGQDKKKYSMVGILQGSSYNTGHLVRFGYAEFTDKKDNALMIKGHEFHYYDSTNNGKSFYARKPSNSKNWECMTECFNIIAGFPHLYYYSCPMFLERFLDKCAIYSKKVPINIE